MRVGEPRVQFHRAPMLCHRRIEIPLVAQCASQVVVSERVLRLQLDCEAIGRDRLGQLPLIPKCICKIDKRRHVLGFNSIARRQASIAASSSPLDRSVFPR